MTIKDLQNMIYNSGKNGIIKDPFAFATNFNSIIQKAFDKFNNNDIEGFRNILVKYFIYINVSKVLDDNFASFKVNDELNKNIEEAFKNTEKINHLFEIQVFIISTIKTFQNITKKEDLNNIDTSGIDISNIDVNNFIQSFNNILVKRDISSILNFIQINGLVELYKSFLRNKKEPILLFKFIYDCINDKNLYRQFKNISIGLAFYELANSINDEALKQNCQFLNKNPFEFPVKENNTKILENFLEQDLNLELNGKKYSEVRDLINVLKPNEETINQFNTEQIKEIKTGLFNALVKVTKGLHADFGFPETLKQTNFSAEQLLSFTVNKRVDRTVFDLIDIMFSEDSIDMFKNNDILGTSIYEGLYNDFKDIFDNQINPPTDTGYQMTDDVNLFWNQALKLHNNLVKDDKISDTYKDDLKVFGKTVFRVSDYMITLKMLFCLFNYVSEERIFLLTMYVTMCTADDIVGKM